MNTEDGPLGDDEERNSSNTISSSLLPSSQARHDDKDLTRNLSIPGNDTSDSATDDCEAERDGNCNLEQGNSDGTTKEEKDDSNENGDGDHDHNGHIDCDDGGKVENEHENEECPDETLDEQVVYELQKDFRSEGDKENGKSDGVTTTQLDEKQIGDSRTEDDESFEEHGKDNTIPVSQQKLVENKGHLYEGRPLECEDQIVPDNLEAPQQEDEAHFANQQEEANVQMHESNQTNFNSKGHDDEDNPELVGDGWEHAPGKAAAEETNEIKMEESSEIERNSEGPPQVGNDKSVMSLEGGTSRNEDEEERPFSWRQRLTQRFLGSSDDGAPSCHEDSKVTQEQEQPSIATSATADTPNLASSVVDDRNEIQQPALSNHDPSDLRHPQQEALASAVKMKNEQRRRRVSLPFSWKGRASDANTGSNDDAPLVKSDTRTSKETGYQSASPKQPHAGTATYDYAESNEILLVSPKKNGQYNDAGELVTPASQHDALAAAVKLKNAQQRKGLSLLRLPLAVGSGSTTREDEDGPGSALKATAQIDSSYSFTPSLFLSPRKDGSRTTVSAQSTPVTQHEALASAVQQKNRTMLSRLLLPLSGTAGSEEKSSFDDDVDLGKDKPSTAFENVLLSPGYVGTKSRRGPFRRRWSSAHQSRDGSLLLSTHDEDEYYQQPATTQYEAYAAAVGNKMKQQRQKLNSILPLGMANRGERDVEEKDEMKEKTTPTKEEFQCLRASLISVTLYKDKKDSKWGIGFQPQEPENDQQDENTESANAHESDEAHEGRTSSQSANVECAPLGAKDTENDEHKEESEFNDEGEKEEIVEIGILTNSGLLRNAPICVGDVVLSIDNQSCTSVKDTQEQLLSVPGESFVTIAVRTPFGNPHLVQAMATKPTPDYNVGLGFCKKNRAKVMTEQKSQQGNPQQRSNSLQTMLHVYYISPTGLLAQSALRKGDVLLAINGKPCSHMEPEDAEQLLDAPDQLSIVAWRDAVTAKEKDPKGTRTRVKGFLRRAKRAGVAAGGGTMLGLGLIIAPSPLPPPLGEALIIGGVSWLSTEFEGPRRVMRSARDCLANAVGPEDGTIASIYSRSQSGGASGSNSSNNSIDGDISEDTPFIQDGCATGSFEQETQKTGTGGMSDRVKRFGRNVVLPLIDKVVGDTHEYAPSNSDQQLGKQERAEAVNDVNEYANEGTEVTESARDEAKHPYINKDMSCDNADKNETLEVAQSINNEHVEQPETALLGDVVQEVVGTTHDETTQTIKTDENTDNVEEINSNEEDNLPSQSPSNDNETNSSSSHEDGESSDVLNTSEESNGFVLLSNDNVEQKESEEL